MANLHKFSVQEALNAQGSGGIWQRNAAVTSAALAGDYTNTTHFALTSGTHVLGIDVGGSSGLIFNFADGQDDCAALDIVLPKGLHFITIPRGLGNTIYFNHVSNHASSTCSVKTVEI